MTPDQDAGRAVYVCQDCAAHYLPPKDMLYPDSIASEVFCSACQPRHTAQEQARRGFDLAENVRKPRPRTPHRAGTAPSNTSTPRRSKLH